MPHPADNTTLADHHYVTLILRLRLDRKGRLIRGELVDTTDSPPERFIGLAGMNQAVAAWLRQQEQAKADEERG
jgi:hypothetical protein